MRNLFLFSLLVFHFPLQAQFHMIGDARPIENGCIMLTPDLPYSEGLAYSTSKLDLTTFFEIEYEIYLGDKDQGADGITFVIHNDPRGFEAFGNWGECMGYGRFNPFGNGNSISPSIAIEFDTYQNPIQNDPQSDHIAYLENGISRHEKFWNSNSGEFNMEDDRLHSFIFKWDPAKKIISALWDGVIVYQENRDLINDLFDGSTEVIWGFTGSTGRAHNLQYFCLRRFARR